MSITDLSETKTVEGRAIAKFRVNFASISIVPLGADGVSELGHDILNLSEAQIEADDDLRAELERIAAAKLESLTALSDMANPDAVLYP